MEAIESILTGEQVVEAKSSALSTLTPREIQIFWLIGEGLPSRVIAKHLFISPPTLHAHRANIKRKLGILNGGELTRRAVIWAHEMTQDKQSLSGSDTPATQ